MINTDRDKQRSLCWFLPLWFSCERWNNGIKVIIENQLETTNYDHLGKIITYASGLDANVVIWIVKETREEHRSAIDWLNNKTTKYISFFLMEIRA